MLIVVVVVVVAVVVGIVMKGKAPASQPNAPAAPRPAVKSSVGGRGKRGLIINHEWTFARIDRAMQECGFAPQDRGDGDEPRAATWRGAHGTLRYIYEPEIQLRKLEVEADQESLGLIVNDIVNLAYVSTIDYQLPDFLDGSTKSPRELLFGIRGSEWIGRGKDHKFYWQKVGKLRDHADANVAAEAKRVYDVLIAEAGGKPTPAGPRGLELTWTKTATGYVAKHRGVNWELVGDPSSYTLLMNGKPDDEKITEWPDAWKR